MKYNLSFMDVSWSPRRLSEWWQLFYQIHAPPAKDKFQCDILSSKYKTYCNDPAGMKKAQHENTDGVAQSNAILLFYYHEYNKSSVTTQRPYPYLVSSNIFCPIFIKLAQKTIKKDQKVDALKVCDAKRREVPRFILFQLFSTIFLKEQQTRNIREMLIHDVNHETHKNYRSF